MAVAIETIFNIKYTGRDRHKNLQQQKKHLNFTEMSFFLTFVWARSSWPHSTIPLKFWSVRVDYDQSYVYYFFPI